jgi:transposase-like protein
MDKTKTPLTKWFLAMHLMGQDKRGCSALRLKRELGIAYDTAWTIAHKIRKAMGDRDAQYMLSGNIEADDGFFGGAHEGSKRGRGTDKHTVEIAVMCTEEYGVRYMKAKVIEHVDKETVTGFAKENIKEGSTVKTDGYPSYRSLSVEGFKHEWRVYDHKDDPGYLRYVHRIISNLKAFILGTYHGLAATHFQRYSDEFCFRLNRRAFQGQLFAHTLNACSAAKPFPRYELCR